MFRIATLILATSLVFSAGVSSAQTTAGSKAKPVAKAASSPRDTALYGVWESISAEKGALKGVLTLEKSGKASLVPEGFEGITGTWRTSEGKLYIQSESHGEGIMEYELKDKTLSLTYNNGNRQSFKSRASNPSPASKK